MNQVESSSSRQTKKIQIWCRHWMKNETFWSPKVNDFSSGWSAGKNVFFFQKIEGYAAIFWIPKNEFNIWICCALLVCEDLRQWFSWLPMICLFWREKTSLRRIYPLGWLEHQQEPSYPSERKSMEILWNIYMTPPAAKLHWFRFQ